MTSVALITGGQRGIGLAIAEALIGAGHACAITSPEDAASDQVTSALDRLGPKARHFTNDVSLTGGHEHLLDRVEDALGPVTTFVSNAGIPAPSRGDLLRMTPENFDEVLAVNLRGAFFLTQSVARRMVATSSAAYRSILMVTSVSATMVSTERGEYCISKAGAAMAADLFAVRLAPHGIGVFEIRPGIIETGMTAGVRDSYTPRIEGGLVPAARWGRPDDVASVAVSLAGGAMAFATGATIPVDGALSIPQL